MARALWKGSIAFGLVNVPVELYPAEQKQGLSFSMIDKRDMSPVGYKRYSKRSGDEVTAEDIVKGYEYEKEQYVVMSPEDFRRANVKASQTVEIKAFVPASDIPLQYFETPYYLAPTQRGEKVYALLRETLRATKRVAVAQVVIRTTQHLAAVVVDGPALVMMTLRYPNEIRDPKELKLPPESLKDAGVTAKEIELAKRLIEDMSEPWDPTQYADTYHDDL
ncbi:MAG: Ku protein, partial [Betaproteobacteria bacterium]